MAPFFAPACILLLAEVTANNAGRIVLKASLKTIPHHAAAAQLALVIGGAEDRTRPVSYYTQGPAYTSTPARPDPELAFNLSSEPTLTNVVSVVLRSGTQFPGQYSKVCNTKAVFTTGQHVARQRVSRTSNSCIRVYVDGHMLPDTCCLFGIYVDCISKTLLFIYVTVVLYPFIQQYNTSPINRN